MMRRAGASIYPMVQNIILACRALGLGTLITTNHMLYEDEVKAVLELPDDVQTYALMPIGYPRGNFGPLTRRALSEVVHADRWSNSWPGRRNSLSFPGISMHSTGAIWRGCDSNAGAKPVPNVVWLRSSINGG